MKKSYTLLITIVLITLFSVLSIFILETKSLRTENLTNQYLYIQAKNHRNFLKDYLKSIDLEGISSFEIKDDFKLTNEDYLKYLNIAYKLEKKGLISIAEKRRGRASRLKPEFNIDDMIFNKLILGFDYLDEVDFSDIYSVVNVIEQLFQKKDDNKLIFIFPLRAGAGCEPERVEGLGH